MSPPTCSRIGGCLTDADDVCAYCGEDYSVDTVAVRAASKALLRGRPLDALRILQAAGR